LTLADSGGVSESIFHALPDMVLIAWLKSNPNKASLAVTALGPKVAK
jgi:hypothetical protein